MLCNGVDRTARADPFTQQMYAGMPTIFDNICAGDSRASRVDDARSHGRKPAVANIGRKVAYSTGRIFANVQLKAKQKNQHVFHFVMLLDHSRNVVSYADAHQ